jgi:hypothetical protein
VMRHLSIVPGIRRQHAKWNPRILDQSGKDSPSRLPPLKPRSRRALFKHATERMEPL